MKRCLEVGRRNESNPPWTLVAMTARSRPVASCVHSAERAWCSVALWAVSALLRRFYALPTWSKPRRIAHKDSRRHSKSEIVTASYRIKQLPIYPVSFSAVKTCIDSKVPPILPISIHASTYRKKWANSRSQFQDGDKREMCVNIWNHQEVVQTCA